MELLLEIQTEEMPPSHIQAAMTQLNDMLAKEMTDADLMDGGSASSSLQIYGTARRLIVSAEVRARQKDSEEEIVGPPRAAAYDEAGRPTRAAEGFARSRGAAVKDLCLIQTDRGEYAGIKTIVEGRPSKDVLPILLERVIGRISFPKMMRWGSNPFRFSRPVKHIFALLDGDHLPLSAAGRTSASHTFGHFLLAPERLAISSFKEYKKALFKHKVIVSPETRMQRILEQMEEKLKFIDAAVFPDPELLNKLVYDVEWPLVFLGTFPEEFLKLPLEILSTAMKKGQNLFSVVSGKKQRPHFIGVADAVSDRKGLIRMGNERVLRARLEDARFFWEQDLRIPLSQRLKGLDNVIYQEQLGSYADKVLRLKKIVRYLAGKMDMKDQSQSLTAAAELCKVDLLTDMVREFSSLQGVFGGLCAREEKYPAAVWKTIYEHYLPASMDDDVPSTRNGLVLSIADKLDSIVGAVGVGIKVTGSRDPFGLRRNAQSICRMILEKKLRVDLGRLIDKSIVLYGDTLQQPKEEIKAYCLDFFRNRLSYIFSSQGYRYDLVDAALEPGIEFPYDCSLRLRALDGLKDSPQFEPMILIAKRVNNILKGHPRHRIDSELFEEKEERELYTTFSIIRENVAPVLESGDYVRAQKMIFRMRATIDTFFDRIMVMAENKKIQRNRLALLQEISKLLSTIADYSKIVV
ncbi:MAG: glycine--tRNA ligase subunit beta [Acidobacteria bacterium]|nr:glycine--tRNA ligase subunit beta [Acidobacteriota bacterium]